MTPRFGLTFATLADGGEDPKDSFPIASPNCDAKSEGFVRNRGFLFSCTLGDEKSGLETPTAETFTSCHF